MPDEVPPPSAEPPAEEVRDRHVADEPGLPSWVPTLIGIVLVALAALAVWTGLRYRNPSLAGSIIKPRPIPRPASGGGPPGEPEPGSSLMFPEQAPNANAPVTGRARAVITGGGAEGVTGVIRMWARRGITFNVVPDDAIIYVNNVPIGEARQFAAADQDYDFPAPGSYNVHITAPGYRDQNFVVTAADNAGDELAKINVSLQRVQ